MPKSDALIRTKLHRPYTRLELVARPRLQDQVARGLRGPLTLVTAPAGFGKTTLVASSLVECGMPVGWLSLDKDDNQVDRFLTYLVAALHETGPALGSQAAQLIESTEKISPETVLTSLINDLDEAGQDFSMVLDDYQFINSQPVHTAVTFLLEHCPKRFHLVVVTRSDPPLPLTRLRARAQAVELRASDLAFSETEAAQFLRDVMGLNLEPAEVALLEERTEGWIAGLQMAALSMRDREDIYGFIAGFSGTNRYILDYLLEEVLANQPPQIQHFLLYTSILERLTASLCDAVLANNGISNQAGSDRSSLLKPLFASGSTSILEHLEQANLFLVPLDDERAWYRYHHLFADLLRAQLQRSLGKEAVAKLHIHASEWLAQHGLIQEAINHASLASDDERVERLIIQHYVDMVNRGEMSEMRYWMSKLSKELIYRRPWLCIYEAYSHSWYGELDEADQMLAIAEQQISSGGSPSDDQGMQGLLLYVKCRVTAMRGDIPQAIKFCLLARDCIPASDLASQFQFDTRVTLGYEYFLMGDYTHAHPILKDTVQLGISTGAVIHTAAAACVLARLYANLGLLLKSYDTYQTAAQMIPEKSQAHRDARALVEIGLADLLCEWNDLESALAHLQQGLALLHFWAKADDMVLAYLTLTRIHLAQANLPEAQEAVEKAFQVIQTRGVFSEARQAGEVAKVRLWLKQGDLEAAAGWVVSQGERLSPDDQLEFENEPIHLAMARVWIALNKPKEAIGLLSPLEESARSSGRMGRLIEILLLQALARQTAGDSALAIPALTECLTLAEPEHYTRIFLDEGLPMQILLSQGLAHFSLGPVRTYVAHLLSQFEAEPQGAMALSTHIPLTDDSQAGLEQALPEPLSPRELEILHLIALGRTNQAIARQLVISPGTVKAHSASIYRKLEVANRTEAVGRARQLGILP
jgi:LuxR family maltose regulon positive regulatory protein